MEIIRYMTLAGVLFSIGVYGALTRRSFGGALLSLSISSAAIALALVTFNRLIQPAQTSGYFFAIVTLVVTAIYGGFVVQFIRRTEKSKLAKTTETTPMPFAAEGQRSAVNAITGEAHAGVAEMGFSRRIGEGFVGVVSFTSSFAFQVTIMMVFVIGYLLVRLSPVAALAFVFGVGALTHILHRRKKTELLKKKVTPISHSALGSRVN